MQGHFWHRFLAQFFMLFHMVALVLLSMVAFLTIFLLAENLQQPIRVFEIGGYWSCHGEQNASYHVKEDKNLYQKMVSKVTLHFVWGHLSRKQTVMQAMIFFSYLRLLRCPSLNKNRTISFMPWCTYVHKSEFVMPIAFIIRWTSFYFGKCSLTLAIYFSTVTLCIKSCTKCLRSTFLVS